VGEQWATSQARDCYNIMLLNVLSSQTEPKEAINAYHE
jgi:hypothetical protein